ncbi:MAG: radical SAM protein [Nanohaloarchaea archaeon]|nr:radical SAM protein [Candidatus Nanohaloarchaea archaeon]
MAIKVLSLHYTFDCNLNCSFCYMRAKQDPTKPVKDFDFFMGFPAVAKELKIPQIALGGGEPTLYPEFIERFAEECKTQGIIVNITTNGANIDETTIHNFKDITMISFSLDKEKIKTQKDLDAITKKMDLVANNGILVGANVLLDNSDIKDIYSLISSLKKHAKNIYLLQKKPSDLKDYDGLKSKLLAMSMLFKNIYVDDSLQLSLGHKDCCSKGRDIISVNPHGDASFCSFDKEISTLNTANDLIDVVKTNYPQEKTTKCPFL